MRGGSYLVVRRIRMALEHWDNTETDFQEQVIGRHKLSGAPLGGTGEFDPLDLDAADSDGNKLIPDNAHVRLGAAASNGGAQILRRAYAYNDGVGHGRRALAALAAGARIRCRAALRLLPEGSARGVQPYLRPHVEARRAEPVHHPCRGSGLFAVPGGIAPDASRQGGFVGAALFA